MTADAFYTKLCKRKCIKAQYDDTRHLFHNFSSSAVFSYLRLKLVPIFIQKRFLISFVLRCQWFFLRTMYAPKAICLIRHYYPISPPCKLLALRGIIKMPACEKVFSPRYIVLCSNQKAVHRLNRCVFPPCRDVTWALATLGNQAGIVGAAKLILDKVSR